MHLVILEVLSNPVLWGWGHSGDLTTDFAPVVGNLTPRFVKSTVFPHPRMGHEIDKCIIQDRKTIMNDENMYRTTTKKHVSPWDH